jgi:hypothetical protein
MPDFTITDSMPTIVTGEGRAQSVLYILQATLAETGNIFRQGDGPNLRGVIVTEPSEAQVKILARRGIRGVRDLLLPVPLTRSHVQDYAERHFSVVRLWRNPKTPKTVELPANFPAALATRMIEARLEALRPLNGIAYTPILRPDGTLVRDAGYDAETGLWIVASPHFDLPEQPTEQQARAWCETLRRLLVEHPFETTGDTVAAIAMLMTSALRASMERAPLLIADAPYGRTGKDYLCGTASLIGTGRTPAVVSLGDNREEQHKRIGHALLLGAPVIVLTNINGVLRSDELAAYLTEGGTITRAYGTVGGPKFAPNGNTVMATGNNIEPGGDLPERLIGCRQDARMEFPGERTFRHDPHGSVMADRGPYLAAVFGLARYAIRSMRATLDGLGGFDDFNRLIRAPLLALTGTDPVKRARQQISASRRDRPERALIDALAMLFADGAPFCAGDIACELKKRYVEPGEDDPWAPLRIKQQDLGNRLRRAKGRRGSTHQLLEAEKPQGGLDVAYYQLEPQIQSADFAESADPAPFSTISSFVSKPEKEREISNREGSAKSAGSAENPPAPYPGSQPPHELPKELRWLAEEGEYRPDLACPDCRCCYIRRRSPTPRYLFCDPPPTQRTHNPRSQPPSDQETE